MKTASDPLAIIVLAAGLGKRMGLTDTPKVVVSSCDRPLIQHVLMAADALAPQKLIVVTGHRAELVEQAVKDGATSAGYNLSRISFARQEKQLGTGDAVKSALSTLKDFIGTILILSGDVPLIREETLKRMIDTHHREKATLTALVLKSASQTAYGRFIRSKNGAIEGIVEARDCTFEQLSLTELNTGVYVVDSVFLAPAVLELKNENAQKEFYLTDIVARAAKEGQHIAAVITNDEQEVQGVNTKVELAAINHTIRLRRTHALITAGVEIEDPASVFIDASVTVAPGAKIGPNVQLRGKTSIGRDSVVEGSAFIVDCEIGAECHVKFGVRMEGAKIHNEVMVGPFAHLRAGTELEDAVKIGNFVETKKAHLMRDAKASHLTYLGDCSIGESSNIGAGTITCNYDGVNKHITTIGKGVFVGSNTSIVAPVTIEDGAAIGAGSVITKYVEKDSLALTRAPQLSKAGWAKSWREKLRKSKA